MLPREHFQVFISHATIADGALVTWLAEALDRLHIRAYIYERYQIGGQNRFETIKANIKACHYFLVLLTKAGIASQWVNQEIGYAVALGKKPIPIFEADSTTGKISKSQGFIELHDPITYYRGQEIWLMGSILYTFENLFEKTSQWRDLYFLSCKCGNGFDGRLDYEKNWYQWLKEKEPHNWTWVCPKCGESISISFPDCHIVG